MKRYLIISSVLILVAVMFTSCTQDTPNTALQAPAMEPPVAYPPAQSGTWVELTAPQAKALVDNELNLMIIDVSSNYDIGHLPGAVNYYLSDGSLTSVIPTLDPVKTYLVYANLVTGYRSAIAVVSAERLVDAGFEKVYLLTGNYAAWVEAGYPVEK